MNTLLIARRELVAYFNLPIAYVVIPAFLVLNAAFLFVLNPFFLNDQATLRPMFEFAPFVFTLFAPAITMRSLAEERRSGMLEVVHAWPISDWSLAAGKLLGAWALLACAVLLTVPCAVSVALLGDLDWGPVVGGYLGLLLLGGAYLSVGLLVSAFTQSQISAFIAGFILCFALYACGQLGQVLPAGVAGLVEQIGFEVRFAPIARGVVDLRDVTYFGVVMLVCLGLTAEWLGRRRWAA